MKIDYSYHYRKWHSDTPEHLRAMLDYYRRILGPHLPRDRQAEVLDVGCGMGYALLALRDIGFESLHGIDCDEGQVAACRARGIAVTLSSDSADYLRKNSKRFDVILALDLIEHIPTASQLEFTSSLASALKSGGMLICTVPNANSSLAGRQRYIDLTHHTSFTEHSLDFLLHSGGFREIRVEPVEFNVRPRIWWLPTKGACFWWLFRCVRLFRRMAVMAELGRAQGGTVPLSLNIMGIARKP